MTPNPTPFEVVETARIRLKPGRSEADLIAASDQFQAAFLSQVDGFLARDLLRASDGSFLDLVRWSSPEAARAIMAAAMSSPDCLAYFDLMEMGNDPAEGVSHLTVLRRYG
jgi:hypothetical protein